MSLNDVETAMMGRAVSSLSGWAIKYPNVAFTPTDGVKYAEIHFISGQPAVDTLGAAGRDFVAGILQISAYYPDNEGNDVPRTDFESIRGNFKASQTLSSNGQVVTVNSCGRTMAEAERNRYAMIVTIEWEARIPR